MYTIRIIDVQNKIHFKGWINLTWDAILTDADSLITEFEDIFFEENEEYESLKTEEEKVSYIKNYDSFHELEDSYTPMHSDFHILQQTPTNDKILRVHKNAPSIVFIYDDSGNSLMGLSACGMNFSDQLTYAYMVVDRCIPDGFIINEKGSHSLCPEAHKELVEFINR